MKFRNTYLYIKEHASTGMLYFGKTVYDPETYLGSGVKWQRHIRKHGIEHVTTLWYCLFVDVETLTNFAISFSVIQDVVKSDKWANLIIENGLDGTPTGPRGPNKKKRQTHSRGKYKDRILTEEQVALWKRPKSPESVLKRSLKFRVKNKDGIIFEGANLNQFCKEHGLDQSSMAKVCRGIQLTHFGWTGEYVDRYK